MSASNAQSAGILSPRFKIFSKMSNQYQLELKVCDTCVDTVLTATVFTRNLVVTTIGMNESCTWSNIFGIIPDQNGAEKID